MVMEPNSLNVSRRDPAPAREAIARFGLSSLLAVDARGKRLVDARTGRPLTGKLWDLGAILPILEQAQTDLFSGKAYLDGRRLKRTHSPEERLAYYVQELLRFLEPL